MVFCCICVRFELGIALDNFVWFWILGRVVVHEFVHARVLWVAFVPHFKFSKM